MIGVDGKIRICVICSYLGPIIKDSHVGVTVINSPKQIGIFIGRYPHTELSGGFQAYVEVIS